MCFFKCLESVEVLTLVGCHHGFNPSVMVTTLPLVAGIATHFDDPSRCRKCKCHLPHELVAQKWCHFLVRRLRNTQVTTWVRICRDANQARRPRSRTLPWSTKRWDDVIFPILESLSFNKLWLELLGSVHHSWWHVRLVIPKCFTGFFLSPASSTWTFENKIPRKTTTPSADLDEPKPQGRDWNLEPMVQVQKGCVLGEGPGSRILRNLAGKTFY